MRPGHGFHRVTGHGILLWCCIHREIHDDQNLYRGNRRGLCIRSCSGLDHDDHNLRVLVDLREWPRSKRQVKR